MRRVPDVESWARRVIREGCETKASAVGIELSRGFGYAGTVYQASVARIYVCVMNQEKQRWR